MRPCPFCESKDVGVKITATSIYAKCRTCLASGPVITRNRRLDRTWNSIPGKEDRKTQYFNQALKMWNKKL